MKVNKKSILDNTECGEYIRSWLEDNRLSGEAVSYKEMYNDIFFIDKGLIGHKGVKDDFANPIVMAYNKNGKTKFQVMHSDTFYSILEDLQKKYDAVITNGITYLGTRRIAERMNNSHALILDLDDITIDGLEVLLLKFYHRKLLVPNYVTLTGTGLHLYYLFKHPIYLNRESKEILMSIKKKLVESIWTSDITDAEMQIQNLNQAYRCVGSKNSTSKGYVTAYHLNTEKYNIKMFNDYFNTDYKEYVHGDMSNINDYKVVLNSKAGVGTKSGKRAQPGNIAARKGSKIKNVSLATYVRFRDKVLVSNSTAVGHRYLSMAYLACIAYKNGISKTQVEIDLYILRDIFNKRRPNDRITISDVKNALKMYSSKYAKTSYKTISTAVGFEFEKQVRNKSNLSRKENLAQIVEKRKQSGEWFPNGKSCHKKAAVEQWQQNNPKGTIAECIRATGITRNTVNKYWKKEINIQKDEFESAVSWIDDSIIDEFFEYKGISF